VQEAKPLSTAFKGEFWNRFQPPAAPEFRRGAHPFIEVADCWFWNVEIDLIRRPSSVSSPASRKRGREMQLRAIAFVLVLVSAIGLTGCGTAFNVQPPAQGGLFQPTWDESRRIYGGVRYDAEGIAQCVWHLEPLTAIIGALIVLDLPLSTVADTLTLPLTVPTSVDKAVERWRKRKQAASEPAMDDRDATPQPISTAGTDTSRS
jgi:uncharacterized protein YceK